MSMRKETWHKSLVSLLCGLALLCGVYQCKTTNQSSPNPAQSIQPPCATIIASDCVNHSQCTLSATGLCMFTQSCAAYPDQPTCGLYGDCLWNPSTYQCTNAAGGSNSINCGLYTLQSTCSSYVSYGCQWNAALGACTNTSVGTTSVNCQAYPTTSCPAGCMVSNNLCQAINCQAYPTTSCPTGCMVSNNLCQQASTGSGVNCSLYTSSSQCNIYPSTCQWYPSSGLNGGVCQNLLGANCTSQFTQSGCSQLGASCQWNGTSCANISSINSTACSGKTSFFSCFLANGCTWSNSICISK